MCLSFTVQIDIEIVDHQPIGYSRVVLNDIMEQIATNQILITYFKTKLEVTDQDCQKLYLILRTGSSQICLLRNLPFMNSTYRLP